MILLKKSTLTLYNLYACTYEKNNGPIFCFPRNNFQLLSEIYFIISKSEIFQMIKFHRTLSINCYKRLGVRIVYSRFKILKYKFSLIVYNVSILSIHVRRTHIGA